jgi:hypothetical protein
LCDEICVCRKAFDLLDAVIKPTGGLYSAMKVFREADLNTFRLYLVSEAFVLVNYEAAILPDFLT